MTSGDACFFLALSKSESFDLEKVVCNHGFFMMAPNRWLPETKTLQRPLRIREDTKSVLISISQPLNHHLRIVAHDIQNLTSEDRQTMLNQVRRMLRISEKDEREVKEFQEMHAEAKKKGFGRLFRSPSLFEDAVKSILLCNCLWKRALSMAEALCQLQPKLASELAYYISKSKRTGKVFIPCPVLKGQKRKDETQSIMPNKRLILDSTTNFPTLKELAMVDEDYLKEQCNLGHRAKSIIDLVRCIENGKLELNKFDQDPLPSYEILSKQLLKVKGVGRFASANILMCLGFYRQIPADSETVRLVRTVHAREICTSKTIEKDVKEIYDKLELLNDYEKRVGKLSKLPYSSYQMVTGSINQLEMAEMKN
ncbi:uncharacterized protein LOC8285388 isoform X2 [Ricinus communis]|uniref:uncharacterized protein LOC8285388 isoform X2 n=1 Tax=Ricinus communis TaxID=3988 RepID=UPI000D69E5C8|nr:uncharacterized protein LOC8285388 isoform X2 [Ricinus communis]|eukprot:XP_025012298.1 uncharacterized protein LOC8285388 isoform X2 [Ricinus communis]